MNQKVSLERITSAQNELELVLIHSIFCQDFSYNDKILDCLNLIKDIKEHIEEQIKE